MRALKPEELDIVAGGASSSSIVVIGKRWHTTTSTIQQQQKTFGGSGGGGATTGHRGTIGTQFTEPANQTPCVKAVPTGVDLQALNNEIKWLADQLAADAASNGDEWAGVVYRMPDGQLYESDQRTVFHPDDIDGLTFSIPKGGVIVGMVHTHPSDSGLDETVLSPDDQANINDLISSGHADPNMVAYINTPDQTGTPTTYAYDANHRTSKSSGCSL